MVCQVAAQETLHAFTHGFRVFSGPEGKMKAVADHTVKDRQWVAPRLPVPLGNQPEDEMNRAAKPDIRVQGRLVVRW